MKKVLVLVMSLVMIVAFASCKKQAAEPEEEAPARSHQISGVVDVLSDGEISVFTDSNESVTFNIENIEVETDIDVEPGDIAEVKYTGDIVNGDTSECEVEAVNISEGEKVEFEGKVTAVEEKKITLQGDKELTFDITGVKADGEIAKGDTASVKYAGVIVDTDTAHAYVKSMKLVKKAEVEPNLKSVNEKVWTTDEARIRAEYNTDSDIIATVKKGTELNRTGILDNGWSRISYKGHDRFVITEKLTAKAPAAKKEEQKKEEKKDSEKKEEEKKESKDKSEDEKKQEEQKQDDKQDQDKSDNDQQDQDQDNSDNDKQDQDQPDDDQQDQDQPDDDQQDQDQPDNDKQDQDQSDDDQQDQDQDKQDQDKQEDPADPVTLTEKGVVKSIDPETLELTNGKKFDITKAKLDMVADEAIDKEVNVEYTEGTTEATHVYFVSDDKAAEGLDSASSSAPLIVIVIALAVAAGSGYMLTRKKSTK